MRSEPLNEFTVHTYYQYNCTVEEIVTLLIGAWVMSTQVEIEQANQDYQQEINGFEGAHTWTSWVAFEWITVTLWTYCIILVIEDKILLHLLCNIDFGWASQQDLFLLNDVLTAEYKHIVLFLLNDVLTAEYKDIVLTAVYKHILSQGL